MRSVKPRPASVAAPFTRRTEARPRRPRVLIWHANFGYLKLRGITDVQVAARATRGSAEAPRAGALGRQRCEGLGACGQRPLPRRELGGRRLRTTRSLPGGRRLSRNPKLSSVPCPHGSDEFGPLRQWRRAGLPCRAWRISLNVSPPALSTWSPVVEFPSLCRRSKKSHVFTIFPLSTHRPCI